ncbi:uncharacterized protein LOC134233020 [Saccostrea cucullata]|uniref:uncharacterized protein LOC134233020 n=1 Tax=Saccostrea cuccullata TaxID=36930 RepID=UPI002ED510D2
METKKKVSKVLTRKEREKQRQYWRIKQKESRERRHPQKIRRKKEKDRERQRKKRLTIKLQAVEKRAKKFTPQKIKVKQTILDSIKGNAIARKKAAKKLAFLKTSRLNKFASTCLGISQSYLSKLSKQEENHTRKTRKDKTSAETTKNIENFFRQGDISTNLPDSKRIKANLEERRVLNRTLKESYREFRENNADEVSFATFARLKPGNVETTCKRKWNACLCEMCTNVDLKIQSLSQLAATFKSNVKVDSKYEAVEKTMCEREPDEKWHKKKCIERECVACGTDGIVAFFSPLMREATNKKVKYIKWERMTKVRNGKTVTQIIPKTHEKSATEVVLDLAKELEKLAVHLFVAAWQQNQFSQLLKRVPSNWVVLNMDFSENYACLNQNEVQSAHWGHNNVTIHPTVAYYRCPKENCNDVIQEALIFVSDDLQHDSHAVATFVSVANEHLQQNRGLVIEKEIQFTDGCAAQYKSKTPFTDISYSNEDYGFSVERHFYGSRHGKGPSDGAGAVVKSGARRAVMGMNFVINNAEDFFLFGKEKLETTDEKNDHIHHKRTFFLIRNINRNRPNRSKTKTVHGTRKLQCVKSTEEKYSLLTRNLSCFCKVCVGDEGEDAVQCENSEVVDQWTVQDLKHTVPGVDARQTRGRGRERGARTRGGGRGIRTRGEGRGIRTRGRGRGVRTRGRGRGVRTRGGGRVARTRGGRRRRNSESEESFVEDSDVSDYEGDRGARTKRGGRVARTREEGTRRGSESEESFVEDSDMSDSGGDRGAKTRGAGRGDRSRGRGRGVRTRRERRRNSSESEECFVEDSDVSDNFSVKSSPISRALMQQDSDYVHDSEEDILQNISGLSAIIAALDKDEGSISPVFMNEPTPLAIQEYIPLLAAQEHKDQELSEHMPYFEGAVLLDVDEPVLPVQEHMDQEHMTVDEPVPPYVEKPVLPDQEHMDQEHIPYDEEPVYPHKEHMDQKHIPDTEEPALPDVEEPALPDVEEPALPDVEEPVLPDQEHMDQGHIPDAEEPVLPDIEEPVLPDVEEPVRPIEEHMDQEHMPDVEEPVLPDQEHMDQEHVPDVEERILPDQEHNDKECMPEVFKEPNLPVVEEPALPDVEEPTLPVVEEPTLPVVEEPNLPVVEEPNLPVVEEPTLPVVEEPTLPVVEESDLPDVKEPVLPDVKEPTLPDVKEPTLPVVEEPDLPYQENKLKKRFKNGPSFFSSLKRERICGQKETFHTVFYLKISNGPLTHQMFKFMGLGFTICLMVCDEGRNKKKWNI